MIFDLKPYPAMKDSGVPWLGEVPEHWDVERIKSSVSNVIESTAEYQRDSLYVALEHVESWTGRIRRAVSNVAFDSQVKRFRAGDVLFGKLRPYLAKVARPISDGVCVGEFLVLRPRGSDGCAPYLEQLLRSKPIIDAVNSSTFGAKMPRADWQFVGGMPVTLPPLPEQTAIVRFLDYADRRIRRYIRAKQKLIKLLEEQKQAIIHRAVTRGLDPNVRLKPSGVEWLGDVPEHWEVRRLKTLVCEAVAGPYGSSLTKSMYAASGFRVYCQQQVIPDDFSIGDYYISDSKFLEMTRYRVFPGDLLVSVMGTVGRVAVVPEDVEPGIINPRLVRYRLRAEVIHPRFMQRCMLSPSCQAQLSEAAKGTTMEGVNMRILGDLLIPVPPLDEQEAIVNHMAERAKRLDLAIAAARHEVALLREYRTRLIADVVTGKLDVREAAARLPDETEGTDSLDDFESESADEEVAVESSEDTLEEAEA